MSWVAIWILVVIIAGCFVVLIIDDRKEVKNLKQEKLAWEASDRQRQREIEDMRTRHEGVIAQVAGMAEKIKLFEKEIVEIKSDGDHFQDHLHKVRDSVFDLKDRFSNKRPVLKSSGPIQVSIVNTPEVKKPTGKGISSLIKEAR